MGSETKKLYSIEKSYDKIMFTTPEVNGCYSISGINKVFSSDAKQLKYWNKNCPQEGKVYINLNDNPGNHIRRDPKDPPELLNDMLKYIMMEKQRFVDIFNDDAIAISKSPIVCSRRTLRALSSLPYDEFHDPVDVSCCLYRGVIYLYCLKNPEVLDELRIQGTDWGNKFEQFMVADSPNSRPNTSRPVIQYESASLVLRANLKEHHLIYDAEVDGVVVHNENMSFSADKLISQLNNSQFVELKTRKQIIHGGHQKTFSKRNAKQWWLHSLFGRNEFVLCGFKNENGVVREIKKFDVKSLPNHSNGFWNADVCLNSCHYFLSFVKSCFAEELQKLNINEENIRSAPKIEFMLKRELYTDFVKKCKNPEGFTLLPKCYENFFDKV